MVITAAPAEASNGVQIGEIDVHDISATGAGLPDDTWFFMGDSITAFAYDRDQPAQLRDADQHRHRARVLPRDDQRRHRRRAHRAPGWRASTRRWR